MVTYNCQRCGYETNYKANYKSHLLRKMKCEAIFLDVSIESLINNINIVKDTNSFKCDYCNKIFKSSQLKYQHKQRCKQQSVNNKINLLEDEIVKLKQTHIITSTTNNTQNNNNIINNITVNIPKLKNFGMENMDALPESLISTLFMDLRFRELLANLHCDPKYPENQNVRIKSAKRNTMEIFRNNKWDIVTFTNGLTELLLQGHKIFADYYQKDKTRILDEDMSEQEITEAMIQLEKIEKLNKDEIRPLLLDLELMLEEYRENGRAIVIKN
jgi:hypothetical protein